MSSLEQKDIIEITGRDYDQIIFEEDFIPSSVYFNQISIRNKFLSDFLSDKKFQRTLDLGCGTGFHHEELQRHSSSLISVDLSKEAIKVCKKKYPGDYIQCDINYLPFKSETFNLVWTAGVLHHTPRTMSLCISGISRILHKNGLFIVDEPNLFNPINFLVLLLSKADPTGDEKPLSGRHIRNIMHKCNLSVINVRHYGFTSPFALFFGLKNIKKFEVIDTQLMHSILSFLLLRWVICAQRE